MDTHVEIEQAKKDLAAYIASQQESIHGIQPPDKALEKSYQEKLKSLGDKRGAPLFFPYLGSGIGKGPFVKLLDGSVKYDFITGIGVHFFGHSHPALIDAAIDAALSDLVMQGNLQQNEDQAKLIEELVDLSGLDHCFLTTSGAMAVENGLKAAFQKKYPASRVLAFQRCFTGRTLATAAISDKAAYKVGIPQVLQVDYIPYYDEKEPEASTKNALARLKEHLTRYPGQHAAMLFELVQGEGGCYAGATDFFRPLMEIAKNEGIAVFIDEVQTFGRTSEPFAFQHFKLQEFVDIAAIGKMTQICATLYKKEWNPMPGLLSQTFTSSTSAIKAARAILRLLQTEKCFGLEGKNMKIGRQFSEAMALLHEKYPKKVSGPYGLGAMCGLTPFDGSLEKGNAFVHTLYQKGVMSFIAGSHPTRIRFLIPSGAATPAHLAEVLTICEETLQCI